MGAFSRGCSKHVNPISQTFVFCKVAKEQHAANLCTPILGDAVLRKMILGEFCFASSANPPISAEKADSRVAGKKTKPKQQLFSFFKLKNNFLVVFAFCLTSYLANIARICLIKNSV